MAVNPLPFLANMPDPGQAFLQAFNQARAQRDQQIAQQSRQAQYAQWVQRLQQDPSPDNITQFNLAFPEMVDFIDKAFAPMKEAEKTNQVQFYGNALGALQRGDKDYAKQIVQERLEAAKNTPGRDQEVAELTAALKQIDSNPDALKASTALTLQRLDPKAYEALYAQKDLQLDTSLIKNLVAEGLTPGTEEFKQALREERTKVTITDPRIGFFSGPAEEFRRRFGGEPPATAQRGSLPSPKSKADFDALPPGTQFKAPDGTIRTKPGGASSNASGGFPGSGR